MINKIKNFFNKKAPESVESSHAVVNIATAALLIEVMTIDGNMDKNEIASVKKNISDISWIRLENSSLHGTPDLLGYNTSGPFFTLELKVTKSNKVRFSPHQIAFHVKHPNNTFILVEHLGQRSVKLFPGSMIRELDACGLALDPLCLTLDACCLWLSELGA